ncbi:MAG: hypothetical protein V4510_02320 [bacterium]
MKAVVGLLLGLLLAGCSSSSPTQDASTSATGPPLHGAISNATAPIAPVRLTWNLDTSYGLVAANVTSGQIAISGGSDPTHERDLLRFTGQPVATAVWMSNFTVHLIFETSQAWTGDLQDFGGVEVWFGYDLPDDAAAAPSFPVNGQARVALQQAGTRFDVRINDTALTPGGVGIPAGARPVFLVAVQGSQSAAAPLYLDVGGDKNSHVHPVVAPWNRTTNSILAGPHQEGSLGPGVAVGGGSASSSPPIPILVPADARGMVVVVSANGTNGVPTDLDLQLLDASGAFLAESNSPYEREALRFYDPNLNATGRTFMAVVDDGSGLPAHYYLQVFFLVQPSRT